MKKILLSISCLFLFQIIGANNNYFFPSTQTTVNVVEVTDTTLDRISYANTSYDEPTKLVFTNLTTISGNISFSNTTNLVAVEFPVLETITGNFESGEFNSLSFHQNGDLENVDFPLLKSIQGYLYFHQNLSLKTINLNSLESVYNYVYAGGNTSLEIFDICNLKEILPQDEFDEPYYSISNNTALVDTAQPCWESIVPTDITLDNNSLNENETTNSLIGNLTEIPSNENVTFYFDLNDVINDQGEEYSNNSFKIVGNQLRSNFSFDFEAKNVYHIKIWVRNNFGEKFGKDFTINILDVSNENINIIEIDDSVLDNISYFNTSFDEPTKLIFTNLISVNGSVNFSETSNLVVVEFPKLVTIEGSFSFYQNNSIEDIQVPMLNSTGSHVYFDRNLSLKTINLIALETVHNYVYARGNTALEALDICNLKQILPMDEANIPYYSIGDNTSAVDAIQPCWGTNPPTDISIDANSILENQNTDALIGNLTGSPSNENLTFYFDLNDVINDQGEEYANDFFKIVDNQLIANASFDFEATNEYQVKIWVRNNYGEKLGKDFIINIEDIQNETTNIIEITDTTLDGISYSNTSFTGPTRLVFTNLTTINGDVYFNNNLNIQSIEFPLLETINGYVYFSNNHSLEVVDLPALISINDYIYVSQNNLLSNLNICSLSEIVQSQSGIDPYYYIKNNPVLNYDSTCLTNTVITLNYLDNITEEDGKLLAATFSSNAGADFTIKYFFVDDDGNEITNEDFEIINNKLFLTKDLTYYIDKEFVLKVGAIRFENTSVTKGLLKQRKLNNGLNERIEEKFNVSISGTTLGIEDSELSNALLLYPNPASETIFIKNDSNDLIEEVQVFDVLGKLQEYIRIDKNGIPISHLNAGVYTIRFKINNRLYSKKFIKS